MYSLAWDDLLFDQIEGTVTWPPRRSSTEPANEETGRSISPKVHSINNDHAKGRDTENCINKSKIIKVGRYCYRNQWLRISIRLCT
jgi:hypothetical protein